MANNEAWMTAEVGGPKRASLITKPEVAEAMIRRARRPILVIGHLAAEIEMEDKKLIDYVIDLATNTGIPVVATAHTGNAFLGRRFTPASIMSAVDIGNRLADPTWKGIDGNGPYDLAMFAGLPYSLAWTLLSGLKNFAPHLKTMTLDNVYHPNANWSFPNISIKDWIINLQAIIRDLGE
ncbi:MAG: CO dehydrogenase/acetyl-CoA synthase complex subunit epsilon [Methanomicrobiales archaeon]|nr:CO dehydrogenase/acetyl-CoA synthase complex subunit epsilon [Methanomicrobiales archaeon]